MRFTREQLLRAFRKYDRDNNRIISPEEIMSFMLEALGDDCPQEAEMEVTRIMKMCDRDKDGLITFKEFRRALNCDE